MTPSRKSLFVVLLGLVAASVVAARSLNVVASAPQPTAAAETPEVAVDPSPSIRESKAAPAERTVSPVDAAARRQSWQAEAESIQRDLLAAFASGDADAIRQAQGRAAQLAKRSR